MIYIQGIVLKRSKEVIYVLSLVVNWYKRRPITARIKQNVIKCLQQNTTFIIVKILE